MAETQENVVAEQNGGLAALPVELNALIFAAADGPRVPLLFKAFDAAKLKAETVYDKSISLLASGSLNQVGQARLRSTARIFGADGSSDLLFKLLENQSFKDDLKTIKVMIKAPPKQHRTAQRALYYEAMSSGFPRRDGRFSPYRNGVRFADVPASDDVAQLRQLLNDATEAANAQTEAAARQKRSIELLTKELEEVKSKLAGADQLRIIKDVGHAIRLATNLRVISAVVEKRAAYLVEGIVQHPKVELIELKYKLGDSHGNLRIGQQSVFTSATRVDIQGARIKVEVDAEFGGKITALCLKDCVIEAEDLTRLISKGAPRLRRLALINVATDPNVLIGIAQVVGPTLQHLTMSLTNSDLPIPGAFFGMLRQHGALRTYWARNAAACTSQLLAQIPLSVTCVALDGVAKFMTTPAMIKSIILDQRSNIQYLNLAFRGVTDEMMRFYQSDIGILHQACIDRNVRFGVAAHPTKDLFLYSDM